MDRNLFRVLAVTALSCGCLSAQSAPADDFNELDSQPARVFRTTVRDALNREDFAQLENIAATVRAEKARFLGGLWKLGTFYATVQGPGSLTSSDAVWTAHIARLKRWGAAYPESITPRVALAQSYIRYAWKARGNGFANTVTEQSWKQFGERIASARATLEQARPVAGNDPQWYRSMLTVALAQGWPRAEEDELAQSAIAAEPAYYSLYVAHAYYLLPRWHGKAGESEEFAASSADRLGGQSGSVIYFMIAQTLDCCGSKNILPTLPWDRIKEGFNALEGLYGSTNYQRNVIAYLAVRNHDQEFANQMFARIGDDWNETVWKTKANFNHRTVVEPAKAEE